MGSERAWLVPTLTLTAVWAVCTVGMVGLVMATDWTVPKFVGKVVPFVLAGYVTGRLVSVAERRPKIIAAAVLTVVSAVSWTLFTLATSDLDARQALTLFAASLPVMLVASAWAYLGMFLGQGADSTSSMAAGPRDVVDDLERELRGEIAGEPPKAGSEN